MRRALAIVAVISSGACGSTPDDVAFGFVGELRNHPQRASVISLWIVGTADPDYLFKFGDGTTVIDQFEVSYRRDPPPAAVNSDGIGIAMIAILPGLATLPEGKTSLSEIVANGLSQEHAVVWKGPEATGPAWAAAFGEGFSCAACTRSGSAEPDTLAPIDCSFVVVQPPAANQCVYY